MWGTMWKVTYTSHCVRILWRNHLSPNIWCHNVRGVGTPMWGGGVMWRVKYHVHKSVNLHSMETIFPLTSGSTNVEVLENPCGA